MLYLMVGGRGNTVTVGGNIIIKWHFKSEEALM